MISPLCIFIVHNLIQNICKTCYDIYHTSNLDAICQTVYTVHNKRVTKCYNVCPICAVKRERSSHAGGERVVLWYDNVIGINDINTAT